MSSGFMSAGIQSSCAIDIEKDAVSTFNLNNGNAVVLDISSDMEKIISQAGQPFIITGGPPCQGFSSAGKQKTDDPRSALVINYLQIISRLKPSWFFFENVEGILTTGGGAMLFALLDGLKKSGYTFGLQRINCAGYGLPQARRRVIVFGNHHGLNFSCPEPEHGFVSLRGSSDLVPLAPGVLDALSGLPEHCRGKKLLQYDKLPVSEYEEYMRRGENTDLHVTLRSPPTYAEKILPGMSMKNLPAEQLSASWSMRASRRVSDGTPSAHRGGAPNGIVRLHPQRVSLTITGGSTGELLHPTYNRFLSLRECARLQGFHDGYRFYGSSRSVARQIGNAFPSPVAEIFAHGILKTHGFAGTGNSIAAPEGLIFHNIRENGSAAIISTSKRLSKILVDIKI